LHNDVKPDNISVRIEGNTKHLILLDFDSATLTTNGRAQSPAGTRIYLSPTRLQGAEYDATADVASAGLVLCEVIFGRLTFQNWSPSYTGAQRPNESIEKLMRSRPTLSQLMRRMITAMITETRTAEWCYQTFVDMTTRRAAAS
jgi:serine/threonine protein kinase